MTGSESRYTAISLPFLAWFLSQHCANPEFRSANLLELTESKKMVMVILEAVITPTAPVAKIVTIAPTAMACVPIP